MPLLPSLPAPPVASPDEQQVIRAVARRAEDEGDLVGARRLLALLRPAADVHDWSASLDAGLVCRDDAERALWLLQPAFRDGCTTGRRHVLRTLAADVLRARGIAAVADDPASTSCAMRDPLLVDAGLFDLGMLAEYLARVLVPQAHPLAAVVQSWIGRPAGVWEVVSIGAEPVLRHLVDRTETAVPFPTSTETACGDLLYGRVVPLPTSARFTTTPVPVDRITARRVLRAVARAAPAAERLRAVAAHQRRTHATGAP